MHFFCVQLMSYLWLTQIKSIFIVAYSWLSQHGRIRQSNNMINQIIARKSKWTFGPINKGTTDNAAKISRKTRWTAIKTGKTVRTPATRNIIKKIQKEQTELHKKECQGPKKCKIST